MSNDKLNKKLKYKAKKVIL